MLRGDEGEPTDRRALAWAQSITGAAARRDYIAIDESGDFDPVGAAQHSFLVTAAVHTDAGNYPRIAELFLPWRRIVYESREVKASSGALRPASEDRFLHELRLACDAGYCAVTLGIVEKIAHRRGALVKPNPLHELRLQLHDTLLRRHLRLTPPRSDSLLLLIDQYGLDRGKQVEQERNVNRVMTDLSLGRVAARVQFCDSLVVEMIQIADLVAGTVRRRLDSNDFTLLEAVAQDFIVRDLTER